MLLKRKMNWLILAPRVRRRLKVHDSDNVKNEMDNTDINFIDDTNSTWF